MFDEEEIDLDEVDATKREYVSMNQDIQSQKLTKEEIEEMKNQNMSKEEMIEIIKNNNE